MATNEGSASAEAAAEGRRWIERLAGERLLRADFAYGDELRLHFGEEVPYESPALAERRRGEWVLSLRATPWVLVAEGTILSRSHDPPHHVLRQFEELEDKRLVETRLRRSDAAVTLRFENAWWFMALTEPRSRHKNALDLWELLTPQGSFVVARPDRSLTIEGLLAGR